jgi:hypothetical protein
MAWVLVVHGGTRIVQAMVWIGSIAESLLPSLVLRWLG